MTKVLIVSKQSAYTLYFLNNDVTGGRQLTRVIKDDQRRFEAAHQLHYSTLEHIKDVLTRNRIPFEVTHRGRQTNYEKFNFIITVGGDGTFLEAARHVKNQVLLGINSAPTYSVGRFCAADQSNFEVVLKKILCGKARERLFQRLQVEVDGETYPIKALNDLLICHRNPAFLCRYYLKIGKATEEQRGSGVWVSTPAGSTGAIRSAGGKILPVFSRKFQYQPRELYHQTKGSHRLTGGILGGRQTIEFVSLMRNGIIYLDGAHYNIPLGYGAVARIRLSSSPIRSVGAG
jgi:NAD+ kinase